LTDQGLMKLAQAARQLTHLILTDCRHLTDHSLCVVAQRCHELQVLSVANCAQLTDQSMWEWSRHCPLLQSLDISFCVRLSDASLRILPSFPHLQIIRMEEMSEWNDPTAWLHVASCAHLRVLDVSYCPVMSDDLLHALALGCPRLEEIGLSRVSGLTSGGMQRALTLWPRLHTLRMQRWTGEGMDGWRHDGLRHIDVSWCGTLRDDALIALANGCPRLQTVELAWCEAITEASLSVLVSVCPSLAFLHLRCCSKISPLFLSLLRSKGYQIYL